jgi:hypothetical protein
LLLLLLLLLMRKRWGLGSGSTRPRIPPFFFGVGLKKKRELLFGVF